MHRFDISACNKRENVDIEQSTGSSIVDNDHHNSLDENKKKKKKKKCDIVETKSKAHLFLTIYVMLGNWLIGAETSPSGQHRKPVANWVFFPQIYFHRGKGRIGEGS